MGRCVLWVEGVDFADTLYDTNRISVIRGASRALEQIAPAAEHALKSAGFGFRTLARGGGQAGYLIAADAGAVEAALVDLRQRLAEQGENPDPIRDHIAGNPKATAEDLRDYAPFAHLKIHLQLKPVDEAEAEGDPVDLALERARAAARVAQLRDPGVRRSFSPLVVPDKGTVPCKFDRARPAEIAIDGPTDKDGQKSEIWHVSRASAARWHYGRALRQLIYEPEGRPLGLTQTAFCDDFGEIVAPPWPKLRDGKDLPVAARGKLAVFSADGDKFGDLRARLCSRADLGGAAGGLAAFSQALRRCLDGLITTLASELFALGAPGSPHREAAVAIPYAGDGAAKLTKIQRCLGIAYLHRFETLTLGGDDVVVVAPSWLGWYVALRFFELTRDWKIEAQDIRESGGAPPADWNADDYRLRFSAGLLFCPHKTPIRLARDLSEALCKLAKRGPGGGLEIEALESVEPPLDGLDAMRARLLGADWKEGKASRLTLAPDEVAKVYRGLAHLWTAPTPFPASQAHRALRAARDAGSVFAAAAADAANAEFERYFGKAGKAGGYELADFAAAAPASLRGRVAAQTYFALQQRDYVRAGGAWTAAVGASR